MRKRELQEVLAEMYADEKGTLLNLFCFHLISADALMDAEACRTNLEKLEKFEAFLEQQEDTEKKTYYQKFAKDAREIIEREATKYEEEEDSDLKFIWGLRSYDDLTGQCDLHSLNDIELLYHKDTDDYSVSVETIYEFEHPDGKAAYLQNLLNAFTNWMQAQGHDTEKAPELSFALEHTNQGRFKTIEEAYLDFRLRVTGFCALCKKEEEK